MLKKVNCTETVSLVPLPGLLEVTETKTISSLTLLRTLEVIPSDLGKFLMLSIQYDHVTLLMQYFYFMSLNIYADYILTKGIQFSLRYTSLDPFMDQI